MGLLEFEGETYAALAGILSMSDLQKQIDDQQLKIASLAGCVAALHGIIRIMMYRSDLAADRSLIEDVKRSLAKSTATAILESLDENDDMAEFERGFHSTLQTLFAKELTPP